MDYLKIADYEPDQFLDSLNHVTQVDAFRELLVLACNYEAYLPYLRDSFVPDTDSPFNGLTYLACFYGKLNGLEKNIKVPASILETPVLNHLGAQDALDYTTCNKFLIDTDHLRERWFDELYPDASMETTPLEDVGLELTDINPETEAANRVVVAAWFDQIEAILKPLWPQARAEGLRSIPVSTVDAFEYEFDDDYSDDDCDDDDYSDYDSDEADNY